MNDTVKYGDSELIELCDEIRSLCAQRAYDRCSELVCTAMSRFPDAAVPHNLYGVVLEQSGRHSAAMKHFRAAWALDPGYRPANWNMNLFGTFSSGKRCAFDESDIPDDRPGSYEIVTAANGARHAVARNTVRSGL